MHKKIVHGLAFKPGKPTLIVKADDVVVLGLPGHPVSALMVMDTVGRRILDEVWNTNIPKHHRVKGVLTGAVKPADGRDSCQMVTVKKRWACVQSDTTSREVGNDLVDWSLRWLHSRRT